jgi:uncharacterized lipoprotein YmbA
MKFRTLCHAICSMLLVACMWTTSSAEVLSLPNCIQVTTTEKSMQIEQSEVQPVTVAKKVGMTENLTSTLSRSSTTDKSDSFGFFLSSAITSHLINSTINTTI